MPDAFLHCLDVPVENRTIAGNAQSVRGFVNLKPRFRPDFLIEEELSDSFGKYLCSASRHGSQSGILQLGKDLFNRYAELFVKEVDFHRSKSFDVRVARMGPDPSQHIQIIFPLPVGMQTPGDMYFM